MKKIISILFLVSLVSAMAFAGGNSENSPAETSRGQGPAMQGTAAADTEEVSLSGTLVMKDGYLVLSVGDSLYSLGGRGTRFYMDEFAEGDVIQVEGTLFTDCGGSCAENLNGHIYLEKVIKDGEEYTFAFGSADGDGNAYGRGNDRKSRGNRRAGRGQGQNTDGFTPGAGNRWAET